MVARDDVINAYRLILGREPESETVIENFLPVPDVQELRKRFVGSPEFRNCLKDNGFASAARDFTQSSASAVDVEISEQHFERLAKHVQVAWERLGIEKPHWSVLTKPEFLPDSIAANSANFYNSGRHSVRLLELAAARAGQELPLEATCFELGCGVGRVTIHLAKRFKHVVACDISYPHLTVAKQYLCKEGATNVTLLQLKTLETLKTVEPFDVFYSIIVLQHNPPPLIHRLLALSFDKVRSGGYAYFQVPVAYPGYRFAVEDYLADLERGEARMEMHVLPQVHLFRLLDEHGFRILDFQRDRMPGPDYHSVVVLAEKK